MDRQSSEFGSMGCFVRSLVLLCVLIGVFYEMSYNEGWPNFVINNCQSFNFMIFFFLQ